MLLKLNSIILYTLIAFLLALLLYKPYIRLLKHRKAGKSLRETAVGGGVAEIFQKLHGHKAWTPTMGWGMFLIIMFLGIALSFLLQQLGYINNTLFTRQETYIILFGFFGMGIRGLIDDRLNIKWIGKGRGLPAKLKLVGMVLLAAWISYRFFIKLGVSTVNLRPLLPNTFIDIGRLYPIGTFFLTLAITNAINITDGLDGLAWGMMVIVLWILAIVTFFYGWYLATTVIWILTGVLLAFLLFNINPAKVFMGDSGALALWGIVSSLLYLLNLREGFFIAFMILFLIFRVELLSSGLQIFRKRVFKRKLFSIAPFHHLLEHKGQKEYTIVMRFRIIQWLLGSITLILVFYQLYSG